MPADPPAAWGQFLLDSALPSTFRCPPPAVMVGRVQVELAARLPGLVHVTL
jgi:hypothetical protein